jgi:hypothetical protein
MERTADLEGASLLKLLTLEEDSAAQLLIQPRILQHWRPMDESAKTARSRDHRITREPGAKVFRRGRQLTPRVRLVRPHPLGLVGLKIAGWQWQKRHGSQLRPGAGKR